MGAFARALPVLAILALLVPGLPSQGQARSAYSPRHTGLEPPGGPRRMEMMPGRSLSRTPEGGMGYTDAYGNTLDDRQPEEKKPVKRLRPGAFGGHAPKDKNSGIPDPAPQGKPLWSFQ